MKTKNTITKCFPVLRSPNPNSRYFIWKFLAFVSLSYWNEDYYDQDE
jgi:hypothetical protein